MNLLEQAATDLSTILGDKQNGFARSVSLTAPGGPTIEVSGFVNDISQTIDPDTGQAVTGRSASVALRISEIKSAGLDIPQNVSDNKLKPWLVEFAAIDGKLQLFKVSKSLPDRMRDIVVCTLEFYRY